MTSALLAVKKSAFPRDIYGMHPYIEIPCLLHFMVTGQSNGNQSSLCLGIWVTIISKTTQVALPMHLTYPSSRDMPE